MTRCMKTTSGYVSTGLLVVVLLMMTAPPAAAQAGGRISLTFKVAVDASIGGVMHESGRGSIAGSTVDIVQNSWRDTHSDTSPLFVAGVGLAAAPTTEVLFNVEYGRVGPDSIALGTADGQPLTGNFDNYRFWGLETGVRVGPRFQTGPYGIATVGFRRVDAISGAFVADRPYLFPSFYDSSTVPTIGFGGGVLFGSPEVGIGFEAMVKYAGALNQGSLNLEGTGLESINTSGARWSLPISVVLRF